MDKDKGIGYIYLDRKIINHWVYQDKPFSMGAAWIDLLLIADHTTHIGLWRKQPTEFKRGDVNKSISDLARRWGWTRARTKRFLNNLQNEHMITIQANSSRTIITIVNYGDYQTKRSANDTTDRPADDPPVDTPDEPPVDTHISNISNISNAEEKKSKSAPPPEPPDVGPDGFGEIPEGWTEQDEEEFKMMYEDNDWKTRKKWAEYWKE